MNEQMHIFKLFHSSQSNGDLFCNYISSYVNEVIKDVIGNIIAHKQSHSNKKLMLVAHADEIGLMITYIDERGFLYFQPIGTIDLNILHGLKVEVKGKNENIIGVIGKKPIHLQRQIEGHKISLEELWIDIGAKNREDALSKIEIGAIAGFCSPLTKLSNDIITAKAMDDRAGLAVLLEVAKLLKDVHTDYDIYFVASSQEEIGFRGAQVVANNIKPDIAIIVDVTHATDYPTCSVICDNDIKLGLGSVLKIGPDVDKDINLELKEIAEESSIPYQMEASPYPSGTDANCIQISGTGVKTALVSIPCRYMHTPNEIISILDVNSAVNIITGFCKK